MTDTRIQPTQLDFDSIKESLKTYLRSSSAFTDYDFEGSAINILLDVLAYNTHLQALNANFALNESFLDTAQLRSSAVSISKALNYVPRSRVSSRVAITLSFQNVPASTPDIVVPKYTKISTTVDSIVYTFYTLDEYVATEANDYAVDCVFYEGRLVTKRFIVDQDTTEIPLYVIPDVNVYVDSLSVSLVDGLYTTNGKTLSRPTSISQFTEFGDIFLLQEAANGYYEILLGDGVMGSKPEEGTIIEAKYLSTNGPDANQAKSFSGVITVDGFTASIGVTGSSYGGTNRESIESIRVNAPRNYAAQDRAVTVEDFKALISGYATYLETMSVWGGEVNRPPEYGTVFVCIKPQGRDTITDTEKTQLEVNVLNPKKIATMTVKFVDPELQYIVARAEIRYDPARTILSKQQLETYVKGKIQEFETLYLKDFDSAFYRSKLLTFIDDSDKSILSSNLTVQLQRRLRPEYGVDARYELKFTVPIASVSSADHVVTSDTFEYTINNVSYSCLLRNKTGTTQLEIYRSSGSGDIIVVDDAGYIDTATNTIVLLPFGPSSAPDEVTGIRFTIVPADQSIIAPNQNLLLRVDDVFTSVTAKTINEA